MIQIRVCTRVLAAFLALCASAAAEEQKLRDEPQRNASTVPAESKSDNEHYEAGRSLAREKRYEDAIREFQRAISIVSTDKRYYDNLAFCLNALGRYNEAIDALNQALSLDQKDSYAHRELGVCYGRMQQFEKAVKELQQCLSLNPSDAVAYTWLGFSLYHLRQYGAAARSLDEALKLRPTDFNGKYWRGLSALRAGQFEEGSRSLGKAIELRPTDFNANFWRGTSLVRERKFNEAIPNFERACEIRPQDKASRLELFTCYLGTGEFQKGFRLFPFSAALVAGAITFGYLVGLALLLPFSLPVRAATFPSLRFALAWFVVSVVGQIGLLPLVALVPALGLNGSVLTALMLAGVPIIIVAATGFARQPWGAPFQLPLRFGTRRMVAIALTLLFLLFLINATVSQIYVAITHKPMPLPHSVPLIQMALRTNPLLAWLAVPLVVPVIEEIFFRGLFYGAFEKRWGIRGAIVGSALVFACVHLQFIGFFYLFSMGLILGWARWRCGSLGLPIAIHGFNNAAVLVALSFFHPK